MASTLTEIDSLEIQVIVDNELDPISKYIEPVTAYGNLAHIGLASPKISDERGSDIHELKMENICCGAHGLSLLIVCFDRFLRNNLQILR
jgi:7,8-dihydropterin-6-yl-methyl-4-(beta-D-ribofuranosyl)aminobenzene 5'-phosphate synthase